MSAAGDSSLSGYRTRRRRARLSALLPLCLAILASLLCPVVRESVAAGGESGHYGAPLKFEAPPVDIDAPQSPVEEPAVQPPAPVPSRTPAGSGTDDDESPPAAGNPAKPVRLFGTVEFRSPIKNLPKWERVRDLEQQKPSFDTSGIRAPNTTVSEKWKALREKLKHASLLEKVRGVNNFFGQWPYKTDRDVWGVEDYWATPREFVQKSGDCEDYAIAKYYGLRDLGVPAEILRIVAVKDAIRNIGHAVVAVFMDNDVYVLDNLTGLLLSHKRLTHYKAQFSINEQYLWRHIQPQRVSAR